MPAGPAHSATRDLSLDAMRGMAILAVVSGHVLMYAEPTGARGLVRLGLTVIYLFNVQAFGFVSGYLATRFDVRRKAYGLLVPLVGWTLLYAVSAGRNAVLALKGTAVAVFTGGTHLWFLWALFVSLLLLSMLGRWRRLLIVVAVVWGVLWMLVPPETGLRTVGYLLPFVVLGREFRRHEDLRGRVETRRLFIWLPVFAVLSCLLFRSPVPSSGLGLAPHLAHTALALLTSAAACLGLLGLSRTMAGWVLRVFALLGSLSIGIYGFNSLLILRLLDHFKATTLMGIPVRILLLTGACVVLSLLVARIPVAAALLLGNRRVARPNRSKPD